MTKTTSNQFLILHLLNVGRIPFDFTRTFLYLDAVGLFLRFQQIVGTRRALQKLWHEIGHASAVNVSKVVVFVVTVLKHLLITHDLLTCGHRCSHPLAVLKAGLRLDSFIGSPSSSSSSLNLVTFLHGHVSELCRIATILA